MNTHAIDPRLLTRAVKVVLVGAGGTGSNVLSGLAVMHHAMVELGHPAGLVVTVIDPDRVSASNVGRQKFWPSDIGQPKAQILVNRINIMMQTKWDAVMAYVDDKTNFGNVDIVIGCVDNRKGRKHILGAMERSLYDTAYYLDIGNREHDGQAILGQVVSRHRKLSNRLPHAADLFPEIIDDKMDNKDDAPSCSLAEALEKQSLFINQNMANAACNMLWELFRYGQIKHHGQFVNIKSGRVTPLPVNEEAWKRFGYDPAAKPKRTRKKKEA